MSDSPKTMKTTDSIALRLEDERLILLDTARMQEFVGELEVTRRHRTMGHGELKEASFRGRLIAVEEPEPGEYAIRRFADERERELFVERRLEQYERMWDGCGCRIDYYEMH